MHCQHHANCLTTSEWLGCRLFVRQTGAGVGRKGVGSAAACVGAAVCVAAADCAVAVDAGVCRATPEVHHCPDLSLCPAPYSGDWPLTCSLATTSQAHCARVCVSVSYK